jgi:antitoxin HicB
MSKIKKAHVGSYVDDLLAQDGLLEECEAAAMKEIIAEQLRSAMQSQRISKTSLSKRMRTSRRALDRLLDPENTSVTLNTLNRAAHAVGRRIEIRLTKALPQRSVPTASK